MEICFESNQRVSWIFSFKSEKSCPSVQGEGSSKTQGLNHPMLLEGHDEEQIHEIMNWKFFFAIVYKKVVIWQFWYAIVLI